MADQLEWGFIHKLWKQINQYAQDRGIGMPAESIVPQLRADFEADVLGDPRQLYMLLAGLDEAGRRVKDITDNPVNVHTCGFSNLGWIILRGLVKENFVAQTLELMSYLETPYLMGVKAVQEVDLPDFVVPAGWWRHLQMTDSQRELAAAVGSVWHLQQPAWWGEIPTTEGQRYFLVAGRLLLMQGVTRGCLPSMAGPVEKLTAKVHESVLDFLTPDLKLLVDAK